MLAVKPGPSATRHEITILDAGPFTIGWEGLLGSTQGSPSAHSPSVGAGSNHSSPGGPGTTISIGYQLVLYSNDVHVKWFEKVCACRVNYQRTPPCLPGT
jgi:hypothetical protein